MDKAELAKIVETGLEILYEPKDYNQRMNTKDDMRWVKNTLTTREINLLLWDVFMPLKRGLSDV